MKIKDLILGILTLFLINCKQNAITGNESARTKDSIIYVEKQSLNCDSILKIKTDSLEKANFILRSDNKLLSKKYDSMKVDNNTIAKKLLHEKQIIENARYYVNIVNKNKNQAPNLLGWMNRALNQ